MTTEYIHRISLSVPSSHIPDANALALVLGENPADINTFTSANYQDSLGNEYAICSTVAKPIFVTNASSQLKAPSFAPDADIESATRAQALVEIGSLSSPVQATPDKITVILGENRENAQDHIAALGLTVIPSEEEY